MNRFKINIFSAFGIPSVHIYGTFSIIVVSSDMGMYIHCRMCLKVKNRVYRVYQNDWSGLEVDYIYKYGEETYKY
jgi:hypothetical protein